MSVTFTLEKNCAMVKNSITIIIYFVLQEVSYFVKMPPKKNGTRAQRLLEKRKNMSEEDREKLRKATRESVQRHRAKLTKEKRDTVQHQNRKNMKLLRYTIFFFSFLESLLKPDLSTSTFSLRINFVPLNASSNLIVNLYSFSKNTTICLDLHSLSKSASYLLENIPLLFL